MTLLEKLYLADATGTSVELTAEEARTALCAIDPIARERLTKIEAPPHAALVKSAHQLCDKAYYSGEYRAALVAAVIRTGRDPVELDNEAWQVGRTGTLVGSGAQARRYLKELAK